MLLSVSNDDSANDGAFTEYAKGSSSSDEWYADGNDEVFVLDFDPGHLLEDPCKVSVPFGESHLFDGEDEGPDTSLLAAPINTLYDPSNLFDVSKDQDLRGPSPISSFSFDQAFLGSQFNLKPDIFKESKRTESPPKKTAAKPRKSSDTGYTAKSSTSEPRRQKKAQKAQSNTGNERKALYGDSWHTVEDDGDGSSSSGEFRKTYTSGNLKQKRTSKFRGVSCCGKDRKWQARIRESNRVRYLGRFQTEVEAAVVYDEASRQCKGESAPTNFVRMDNATMKRVQEAYERLGHIPVSMHHLIANPRKTKPKKKSEKRQYRKRRDSERAVPSTPKAGNKRKNGSSAEISPSSTKLNPVKRFRDGDVRIPSRPNFGIEKLKEETCEVPPVPF